MSMPVWGILKETLINDLKERRRLFDRKSHLQWTYSFAILGENQLNSKNEGGGNSKGPMKNFENVG